MWQPTGITKTVMNGGLNTTTSSNNPHPTTDLLEQLKQKFGR